MEPIEYTIVLKSRYGYISTTGVQNTTSGNSANNADMTFYLSNFFQRLSAVHNCNYFKLELIGGIMGTVSDESTTHGINYCITLDGCLSNNKANSGFAKESILGGFNNILDNTKFKMTSKLEYGAPLYVRDIGSRIQIRINQRVAVRNGSVTGANTPAYSLMFKVTPILN